MYIQVKNATKEYIQRNKNGKETVTILDQVSFTIKKGEFICLLGPSGCGKSTLLNAMAGFETLSDGCIEILGKKVTAPSSKYITIFQNYGLLPWRTVVKNVELGLESIGNKKKERQRKAEEYLKLVGLENYAHQYPCQLSGGQQQRVAIARGLVVNPEILFMDEPFGALDAITRIKLQDDMLRIAKAQNKTVIFVTHDIEEAVFLADKIVVMSANPGRIKSILTVSLGKHRNRTAGDFLHVRDQVFDILNMKTEDNMEYVI